MPMPRDCPALLDGLAVGVRGHDAEQGAARVLDEEDAELLSASANRSNGVLFITGPVGSGKSTVLYAVLNDIIANGPQRKVHAVVENPVDFRLEGIVQTEVSPSAGLTRPVILRHLLLCDPDVIVVPEFPDRQTTESLLTAALARRFAITRLHADDALDALQRVMALSGRHAILVDADVTICCVKMVRALCGHCRERIASRPQELERMDLPPADAGVEIWRPAGCEACGNTGYSGRMGILELLRVDASVAGAAYRAEEPARVREAASFAAERVHGPVRQAVLADRLCDP